MLSPPTPYYQDEAVTIYHGDCREILPKLAPFDLLLTDPPYGINAEDFRATLPDTKGKTFVRAIHGDDGLQSAEFIMRWIEHNQQAVIWGANNFPKLLPHKGRWLCWDKRLTEPADKMLGSAFELAWENRKSGFDAMLRVLHGGVVNADGGKRFHPTQKPVTLFRKVLGRYSKAEAIIDPFAGSGTTGVAAKLEGRKATLIELDERYCEIAANRLSQGVLF
jgi:site-specific DNA-methyltransferase (adenine-specific)